MRETAERIECMMFGASFGKWVSENRSQELAELKGESVITKENVGLLLRLLREWREETQGKE